MRIVCSIKQHWWKKFRRHGNVSGRGGGVVSVPVEDIVRSPKVQRQVEAVKQLKMEQSK